LQVLKKLHVLDQKINFKYELHFHIKNDWPGCMFSSIIVYEKIDQPPEMLYLLCPNKFGE